jgi:ABC-type Fe3+/spermidine/putrescine transport system ATPase subunit
MRKEIRRIQQEFGITTVYVTHDHEEAMALSDRIALMNNGKIEQTGRPSDFYRSPKSDFVREFFGNAAILDGELKDGGLEIPMCISIFRRASAVKRRTLSVVIKPDQLTLLKGKNPMKRYADVTILAAACRYCRGIELERLGVSGASVEVVVGESFAPRDRNDYPGFSHASGRGAGGKDGRTGAALG